MTFPHTNQIDDSGGNTPTTTVGGTPTNPRCRQTFVSPNMAGLGVLG
jgi:hypothetical protein